MTHRYIITTHDGIVLDIFCGTNNIVIGIVVQRINNNVNLPFKITLTKLTPINRLFCTTVEKSAFCSQLYFTPI